MLPEPMRASAAFSQLKRILAVVICITCIPFAQGEPAVLKAQINLGGKCKNE